MPRNPLDGCLYLTPVVEFIGSYQDIGDNRLFVVLALCDGLYSCLGVCEDDDVVDYWWVVARGVTIYRGGDVSRYIAPRYTYRIAAQVSRYLRRYCMR